MINIVSCNPDPSLQRGCSTGQGADNNGKLIGYCPPVCAPTGRLKCSENCLKGDGIDDPEIKMFATPATFRNVLRDLIYESRTPTATELKITIEDFDDGRGKDDGGPLTVRHSVDILPRQVGDDCPPGDETCENFNNNDGFEYTGTRDWTGSYIGGAAALCIFGSLLSVECRRNRARVARRDKWGVRISKKLRTRDMRIIVPVEALTRLDVPKVPSSC